MLPQKNFISFGRQSQNKNVFEHVSFPEFGSEVLKRLEDEAAAQKREIKKFNEMRPEEANKVLKSKLHHSLCF